MVEVVTPWLIGGGPWALVAFFVLAVWQGWLIPRSTHAERVSDLKAAIAALEKTVATREAQLDILLGRVREPTV